VEVVDRTTGEVRENRLFLPIRKDSWGKCYCELTTVFPRDEFIEVAYGSILIHLGAFRVKLISPNIPEEELIESLNELVDRDVVVTMRFKMLKMSKGIKEIDLAEFVPAGRSGKGVCSNVVLPLSSSFFGDVTGEVVRRDKETILKTKSGEIVFDFNVSMEGKVTFSYGLSQLSLQEIREGKRVGPKYNLLKVF